MTYHSLEHPFRPDEDPDMPPELREAFRRWGRASNALRLYKRRGWALSSVQLAFDRERAVVMQLIEDMEDLERNPPLFTL
uniref:Uncharacterized protein n=1 Tax=uncultured prokaryote TaxID=198431 RepID=A0A0H5Q3Q9_9ZZZZ|nr:hypothetical protein [uncultured prokaryote]